MEVGSLAGGWLEKGLSVSMAFTYFFRDLHTLKLIEQHVIPDLVTRKYLDIWDAGCADGRFTSAPCDGLV